MILKFRLWDKQLKILRPVASIDFVAKEAFYWIDKSSETYCYFTECILMQSTGLFDKNGTEIFEGDIIDLGGRKEFIHKIQREKSTGYLKLVPLDKRWSESYFTNFEDKTVFEVIGNIYENPNFLEVE